MILYIFFSINARYHGYALLCFKAQEKFLLDLLARHKDTEYGSDYDFTKMTTVDEFRKKHPLTRYSHYVSYVDKVYAGQDNILTAMKPKILAMTSGTSGKSSMLPSTSEVSSLFFYNGILPIFHILNKDFPASQNLQKNLKLLTAPKMRQSPAGIDVGANSSNPKDMQRYKFMYSTPMQAFEIKTEPEIIYIHLLFALADSNLGMIEANFVYLVYTAVQHLKEKWPQLVHDIKHGTIDSSLNIDPDLRRKLERKLVPNPLRANQIHAELDKGYEGIVKRLWPNLYLILSVDSGNTVALIGKCLNQPLLCLFYNTWGILNYLSRRHFVTPLILHPGSADLYGKLLREHECQGVPFYSPLYAATEGLIGLNLDPLASGERQYTLMPSNMFFEFIPIDESDAHAPSTRLLHEVSAL